jgi:hypothetical protein
MLRWLLAARPRVRHMPGRSWPATAWDDLRLVGLKLIFLMVTRAMSLLALSRKSGGGKTPRSLCCAISLLWLSASGLTLTGV